MHNDKGTMPITLHFDDSYQEEVVLRDGRRLRLRTVRPADRERFIEGLRQLSPTSQRMRFFAVKKHLTEEELSYLTEFDGVDHYALGAVSLREDGTEGEGVGVARFVRRPADPESAEAAVVVLDAWQNRGLGRILLERLMAAARERGILSFRAEFLAENRAVQRLLLGLCPGLSMRRRGTVVAAELPLPETRVLPCPEPPEGVFSAFLRLAAQKLIQLRPRR